MKTIDRIRDMPKVELHVHAEGAVSAETYFMLAQKNGVALPCADPDEWKTYFEFRSFPHFIDVYTAAVSTIKKAEDLVLIVEDFCGHQSRDRVVYTEAFLSASFLVENFRTEEILEAITEGMRKGAERYGVEVRLIPDIARHLPATQKDVLALVKAGWEAGIFIGLGLGGLETGYRPELFTDTFAEARAAGLHVVAHAGEAAGAESIRGAVRELGAERIGHGIRCLEDEALVRDLKERRIPLEVSPTSNYNLGLVDQQERHPIREMVDRGLLCTLNSDDPVMFSTSLSREYELLMQQGFSHDELVQLNRNAIQASFLSQHDRVRLGDLLDAHLS